MNLFKTHYEKFMLLGMLLIFFICLVFVLKSASADHSLNLIDKEADYEMADPQSDEVKLSSLLEKSKLGWNTSVQRMAGRPASSDLVQFTALAVCPHCEKLIPRTTFSGKNCPWSECGQLLPEPSKKPKRRRNIPTEDDVDGDGMPNSYEERFRFASDDNTDADKDTDNDGFSNYYEMVCETDPTNARNHPPLWRRFRLAAVKRTQLPVRFAGLMTQNTDDQSKWDLQINVITVGSNGKKRESTQILRLNELLPIEGRMYKVERIERKMVHAGKDHIDESKIFLVESLTAGDTKTPDRLEMQMNKPVYSSDLRPVFIDDGLPATIREAEENLISVRLGDAFTFGEKRTTGQSIYRLVSFDAKKLTAVLEQLKTMPRGNRENPGNASSVDELGEPMIVTVDGGIPGDSRII